MHSTIQQARDLIKGMDEGVSELLLWVQGGDRSEMTKAHLSANRLVAERYYPQIQNCIEKGMAGANEEMLTKLREIMTVCDFALAEFKKVPTSFQVAFAD